MARPGMEGTMSKSLGGQRLGAPAIGIYSGLRHLLDLSSKSAGLRNRALVISVGCEVHLCGTEESSRW